MTKEVKHNFTHPRYDDNQTYIMGTKPREMINVEDTELAILECQRRIVKGFNVKIYYVVMADLAEKLIEAAKLNKLSGKYSSHENSVGPGFHGDRKLRGSEDSRGWKWEPYTRRYYTPYLFEILNPYGALKSKWNLSSYSYGTKNGLDVGDVRKEWFANGKAMELAETFGIPDAIHTLTIKYNPRSK